jgi:HPt (histidine-containing phosphotransfer) domain-containing protein
MGDEESVDELLVEFADDVRERRHELSAAMADLAAADLSVITRHAHTLKSSAANVGAMELSERARALEAAASGGDRTAVEALLPLVTGSADATLAALGELTARGGDDR